MIELMLEEYYMEAWHIVIGFGTLGFGMLLLLVAWLLMILHGGKRD